jgi:hypothetical protein
MADQTGMKALHMLTTGDPARNATFVLFADANYFLTDFPASTCETCINPAFAWNHGDIQREIANTWVGLVGPGVRREGVRGDVWSDHADLRPTMLSLLGLSDPYVHDGRVLIEVLADSAVPRTLHAHRATLLRLGEVYKQLNAPFGRFAKDALAVATTSLASGDDSSDAVCEQLQAKIAGWTSRRDALATQMKNQLAQAAFGRQAIDEWTAVRLIGEGEQLILEVRGFAGRH